MRDVLGIDRERLATLRQREDDAFAERTPRSRDLLSRARQFMPTVSFAQTEADIDEYLRTAGVFLDEVCP